MRRKTQQSSAVSRAEFDAVLRTLDDRLVLIENLQHTCSIQFERIAQMQVQIDHLQRRVNQLTVERGVPKPRRG